MSIAVRTAIRLHPLAWRERYANEVLGILQDVADDHHGGRIPLSESVPLGARGLWLRARFSFTFWAGLVVIALLIGGAITADVGYLDGSLIEVLLRLNPGLGYALPVLALAAGWSGARARVARTVGTARRLRQLASDSWPLAAFTAVGYVAAVVVIAVRVGSPWVSGPALFIILAQWSMVLVAVAIGQLLGAVLHRVLVIFAAPIAMTVVALLLFAWQTPWNVAPLGFYSGLAYVFDVEPYNRVYLFAGIIVATSVFVVSVRSAVVKFLPVAAFIAIGVVVAVQPAWLVDDAVAAERPHAELVCSNDEPVICLWPEQEAAFGSPLRAQMAEAYTTASALGLPVDSPGPRSIARYALTGIPHSDQNWKDLSLMGLGTAGIGPDDLLPWYADTLPSCCREQPTSGHGEYSAIAHATSILLGVSPERAWANAEDPHTGQRSFDPSDVPNEKAARALVNKWLTDGVSGVRSPD